MKKITLNNIFFTVAVMLGLTGCVNIDYVGQRYRPLPSDAQVNFYENAKDVPKDKYIVIGKASASAPDSYTPYELKEKLLTTARRKGADAIQVVEFKKVNVGVRSLPEPGIYDNGPTGSWGDYGRRVGGSPIYTDAFNNNIPLKTQQENIWEIQAKVLFLRDKDKKD